MKYLHLLFAFLMVLVISCEVGDDPPPHGENLELDYHFEEDSDGWVGDFADLPVEGQDIYELSVDHAQLPEETGSADYAIRIQGHNRSDDLFMYIKRQFTGLKPNTTYQLVYTVELASQYPEESVGIGGSPGSSVFLKAGATVIEPKAEVEEGDRDFLVMNIDKGNQSQDGADMYNIGTIGIEGDEFIYELISRGNAERPFLITTDEDGSIWLIIGTDSGFEGLTVLYYNHVNVSIKEVQ